MCSSPVWDYVGVFDDVVCRARRGVSREGHSFVQASDLLVLGCDDIEDPIAHKGFIVARGEYGKGGSGRKEGRDGKEKLHVDEEMMTDIDSVRDELLTRYRK